MAGKSDKNILVTITAGTVVKALLVLVGFYFVYIFSDLVLTILTAVVIASAIEPATRWFGKYKVPRVPAVISVYLLIVLLLVGLSYTFIPVFVEELASIDSTYNFSSAFSEYVGEGAQFATSDFSFSGLLDELKHAVSGSPEEVIQTISTVFGGLLGFVLIIVFSFYLAVQEDGITDFLKIIIPRKNEDYAINLWRRTQQKIGLWMQGQLLLGFIVGVLVYLGLAIMQVPYAIVLALIAAVAEIIPIFGPVLAAVPAVLLAATHGIIFIGTIEPGFASGLAVAMFYVIVQQFENHLIYPLVVRKVVGVPPLMVIIAIVIGAKLAGFLGIILAVPTAAALMEFTNDLQKEKSLAKKKG